jgi:hypothetical protein
MKKPKKEDCMSDEHYTPTSAEMLASLVTGNASMIDHQATVQRSHRFPLYLFIQIENMSRAADVPVSVIINQLIECGLEAVRKELPEEIVSQLNTLSKKQEERPTKSVRTEVIGKNLRTQSKPKARKPKP